MRLPAADESLIDAKLESEMDEAAAAVQLGRACRNAANIKVRQALGTLYVKGAALDERFAALIRDELNVEEVRFISDARAFTTYQIKPQMRTLGPRYGKLLGRIGAHLKEVDGNEFVDALERDGVVRFELDGAAVELSKDDVLIAPAQKPGFVAETDRDMTVVIDTNLTPELIEKGFVREVVSKLQTMRKEAGFDVVDRIEVSYRAGEALCAVVARNARTIADAVLAASLAEGGAARGRLREGVEHQRREGRLQRPEKVIPTRPDRSPKASAAVSRLLGAPPSRAGKTCNRKNRPDQENQRRFLLSSSASPASRGRLRPWKRPWTQVSQRAAVFSRAGTPPARVVSAAPGKPRRDSASLLRDVSLQFVPNGV